MAIERRYDEHGEIRKMAEVDGYVMVRRPRCLPFVLGVRVWDAMSREGLTEPQRLERQIERCEAERDAARIARFLRGA